ncbi:MAG: hypothetical protein KGJ90_00210 [Patescibacteria group bacterium]|nr:hypothetical protein [Patescibacteria group bacterium]
MIKPTIDSMIAEVRRELAVRSHVYPRFIAAGKMDQYIAECQTINMEAVLELLEEVKLARTAPSGQT